MKGLRRGGRELGRVRGRLSDSFVDTRHPGDVMEGHTRAMDRLQDLLSYCLLAF